MMKSRSCIHGVQHCGLILPARLLSASIYRLPPCQKPRTNPWICRQQNEQASSQQTGYRSPSPEPQGSDSDESSGRESPSTHLLKTFEEHLPAQPMPSLPDPNDASQGSQQSPLNNLPQLPQLPPLPQMPPLPQIPEIKLPEDVQDTINQLPEKAQQKAAEAAHAAAEAARHLPEKASHAAQEAAHAAAEAARQLLEEPQGPEAQRHSIHEVVRDVHRQVQCFFGFGAVCVAALWVWAAGMPMRRDNPYTFFVTLPHAEGIRPGTPVRLKGVLAGTVKSVSVDLHKVTAELEINQQATKLPKSSLIEFNRVGMMNPECFLDIRTEPLRPRKSTFSTDTAVTTTTTQRGEQADVAVPERSTSMMEAAVSKHMDHLSPEDQELLIALLNQQRDMSSSGGLGGAAQQQQSTLDQGGSDTYPVSQGEEASSAVLALKHSLIESAAPPSQVQACKKQGLIICAGEVVEGRVGGSADELTRMMVKQNRGKGKVQCIEGIHC